MHADQTMNPASLGLSASALASHADSPSTTESGNPDGALVNARGVHVRYFIYIDLMDC